MTLIKIWSAKNEKFERMIYFSIYMIDLKSITYLKLF